MQTIYKFLQSDQKEEARTRLIQFVEREFGIKVDDLWFETSAVSLNSFKGCLLSGDERYFFKTHIEQEGEIQEYAGGKLLGEAGYPVIAPIFSCVDRGRELLIYPYIKDPSLFEVVNEGMPDLNSLKAVQEAYDQRLFKIYQKTFEEGEIEFPAVQQLFYKRLNGARFERFYGGREALLEKEWVIDGRSLGTLNQAMKSALADLSSENQLSFSVIGHGDAHNGNVFWASDGLKLFDPAYAGRMDPFLDLAKPLFHNTFARWMYFPDRGTELNVFEQMFLESKMKNVLKPLVRWLDDRGLLPVNWESRLRSALFCCPFLTVNLFDDSKYPKEVREFGLQRAMEMANFNFSPYLS